MAEKKKNSLKAKGVANLITSFLKREPVTRKKSGKPAQPPKEASDRKQVAKKAETPGKRPVTLPKARSRLLEPTTSQASPSLIRKNGNGKNGNGKATAAVQPAMISPKSAMAGPKYFFHSDIPDSYNDTYMRAMPRDPEWLFVYWEISESFRSSLKSKMGNAAFDTAKKILRICDVTDIDYNGTNAQNYTDIEINDFANNWYVHVPDSGRAYVVDCGFLTSDGKFFLAVRSNVVNVPHFGLSPVQDQEWTTASTDELIRMSADGLKGPPGASEKRFGVGLERAKKGEVMFGLGGASGSGMFGMPSSRT